VPFVTGGGSVSVRGAIFPRTKTESCSPLSSESNGSFFSTTIRSAPSVYRETKFAYTGRYSVRISRPGKARRDGTEAEKRRQSIWKCPACGSVALSAIGLSHHLALAGDVPSACPVVRAEWLGQSKLEVV